MQKLTSWRELMGFPVKEKHQVPLLARVAAVCWVRENNHRWLLLIAQWQWRHFLALFFYDVERNSCGSCSSFWTNNIKERRDHPERRSISHQARGKGEWCHPRFPRYATDSVPDELIACNTWLGDITGNACGHDRPPFLSSRWSCHVLYCIG